MQKIFYTILFLGLALFVGCGTPNDPESIIGGDGGYKIVSKFITSGNAQDIVINDTLALLAQGEGGLMIIDISNPKAPVGLSTVDSVKGYGYKLVNKDSVVYIAAKAFGVSIIDVSDPEDPVLILSNTQPRPANGFNIMGDFLFTAAGEYGVKIAYLGDNPAEPDFRGGATTHGFAQSVFITPDSNYLLVACGEMGLSLFNISELQSGWGNYPIAGWIDTPGYAEDVVAHPELPYAFIACGTSGLFVADFSDSSNIKIIGSYSTGGYAKEVVYKDNKVYVTTELRGLQIFDVTNVNSPVRIGTVETAYAMGLAVDENYVYIADEQEGLIIISIP